MNLAVFFSYDVSLQKWKDIGIIDREIKLYNELIDKYNFRVKFFTYGNRNDNEILPFGSKIEVIPLREHFTFYRSKYLNIIKSFFIPLFLKRFIYDVDVIKTNQTWGGWVAVLCGLIYSKPVLARSGYNLKTFSQREKKSKIYIFFINIISWFIYRFANLIVVATEFDKFDIINSFKIKSKKIRVQPNWIDTVLFSNLNYEREDTLLFVGRLSSQKNLNLLFDSIFNTNIKLDIYGDGPLINYYKKLSIENKLKVTFKGNYPNNKMKKIYNKYKVMVICSNYEGNPKVLLEAMSCGCAVIGTNVIGIKEIINNRINGLLVEKNPLILKNTIIKLLKNNDLRKILAKNGENYIKSNNSLSSILDKEVSHIKMISKRKLI